MASAALRWSQEGKPAAMTYGELAALTNRIAHVLVEDMKLVPGNRLRCAARTIP